MSNDFTEKLNGPERKLEGKGFKSFLSTRTANVYIYLSRQPEDPGSGSGCSYTIPVLGHLLSVM